MKRKNNIKNKLNLKRNCPYKLWGRGPKFVYWALGPI